MWFWKQPDGVFSKLDGWISRARSLGFAGEVVVAINGVTGPRQKFPYEIESAVWDALTLVLECTLLFCGDMVQIGALWAIWDGLELAILLPHFLPEH